MRKFILAATALISLNAQADLVCAGKRAYLVETHRAFGVPPEMVKGLEKGTTQFVYDGKLLGKNTHYVLSPSKGNLKYEVKVSAQKILAEEHERSTGWKVFEGTLLADDGTDKKPLTDFVVCRETYAAVP